MAVCGEGHECDRNKITRFRESRDLQVKGKRLIERDTKEFDLGSEWYSGA